MVGVSGLAEPLGDVIVTGHKPETNLQGNPKPCSNNNSFVYNCARTLRDLSLNQMPRTLYHRLLLAGRPDDVIQQLEA